ncbi:MAG: hypothetical protein OXP12_09120 [Thaumarchaeota archaeon]|nr:hypothetical protein [Nitrososphaerota archaeon]
MTSMTGQHHKRARAMVREISNKPTAREILRASEYRDESWKRAGITSLTRSMDLHTASRDAVRTCVKIFRDVVRERVLDECTYVEPSAGTGAFLEFLPAEDTIAMDILPRHPRVQRSEFLTWMPSDKRQKYAVVGAPPLGVRSDVSVAFVNHALEFAGVVGMIVRRHIGERQVPHGRLLRREPLESAVTDMTGGFVRYEMEFRVWGAVARDES